MVLYQVRSVVVEESLRHMEKPLHVHEHCVAHVDPSFFMNVHGSIGGLCILAEHHTRRIGGQLETG
jgi:hypothetical protein